MDERQATQLQRVAVNEALPANPEALRQLMEGLGGTNLAGAVVEVYEALRSSGSLPERPIGEKRAGPTA
jgi:hypothetical protein